MSTIRMRETSMDIPLDKMNLSFAGCGFLGIYHVGVASCFREYCPTICSNHFSGASVGALVATAMALDLSLGESTSQILKVAIKARSRALGPFHPTFDVNKIITDALDKTLPEDAHIRVNGRLHISVTRVSDGKNVILSHFDSKQDLIQAVMCSCFIPCWSGLVPPKFHGVAYMDGGLSDNLPNLDDYTITISPFSGESDICPRDTTFNLLQVHLSNTSFSLTAGNLYRITRILFPPHPEVMSKMCEQGFNDALKFLQRNNKISCLRCVAIQSSFLLSDSEESDIEEDEESEVSNSSSTKDHSYDDCAECQNRREMCDFSCLPVPVVQAIQEATDAVNKGLINWIFKHRPVKILSLLTLPVVLPFDITLVVLIKTWRLVPAIKQELKQSLFNLLGFVTKVVNKVGKRKDHVSAKFSCQLAITEFDYGNEPKPTSNVKEKVVKKRKTSVYSIPQTLNSQISSMISTNGSGNIQSKPRRYETMPSLMRRNASDNRINSNEPKVKRKSYAGKEEVQKGSLQRSSSTNRLRRKSMIDILNCKPSERVIERMNFGFTVDIPTDNVTCRSRKPSARSQREGQQEGPGDEFLSCHETENVIHALKSLENTEMNPEEVDLEAIEMTNKALILEKEYLNDSSRPSLSDSVRENADTFAQIMNVASNHEALMKFYYLDEKKRVKVTEIFNIPDDKGEPSSLSSSMIKNTFVDNSHNDPRGPKRTYS